MIMMLTATISVTAVSEPDPVEYVDIDCQPSAVSVDCNNVQSTPLKLNALLRIGAESNRLMYSGSSMYTLPAMNLAVRLLRVPAQNMNIIFRLTNGAMRIPSW